MLVSKRNTTTGKKKIFLDILHITDPRWRTESVIREMERASMFVKYRQIESEYVKVNRKLVVKKAVFSC